VIRVLGLLPHPEGGYYRETFRDAALVRIGEGTSEVGARAASTAIYFLLAAGEVSRWHRIDAAEVWHWYAGAPLELGLAAPGSNARRMVLGPDIFAGEQPQLVVPARHWQRAKSLGAWTLVGCTVAPGFEFSGFEMAYSGFEPVRESNRA
jgi:hypothetical protein